MNLRSPEFDLRAYLLGTGAQAPAGPPRHVAPGHRFRGRWSLERDLLDRADGTRGTFSGVAIFTPADDGGLSLREEGTMRWPSFTGPAFREYLLEPTARPDALDVAFPDGRPFHRMSFAPQANLDNHWCDPDTYQVTYTWEGPDAFSYSWDVVGPRKDLLLTSRLVREVAG